MKHRAALAFILAAIVSAAIWASSPLVTGHEEPWDAEGYFYIGSLLAVGVVSGFSITKPLWAHYLGSVLGQATYELIFLPLGPLFVLGIGFLLGYSLLFLVGALIGSKLRRYIKPTSRRPSPGPPRTRAGARAVRRLPGMLTGTSVCDR